MIHESCIAVLTDRVEAKPSPPADWSRPVPKTTENPEIWKILAPFLKSPTQQVYDYRRNADERSTMEWAVDNETVDLRMETVKSGRPYLLKLIKTAAGYERALREREEDLRVLGELNGE